MKHPEIFQDVDLEKLAGWLRLVGLPLLRTVFFFEGMGFPSVFVRAYFRKYRQVLRPDGRILRKVRGVHEVEFLRGVADALGVRPFEAAWDPRDTVTTMVVARKCLEALPALDNGQVPDAIAVSMPDLTAQMASPVTGETQ